MPQASSNETRTARVTPSQTSIRHPALRYHGGKWLLGPWIISHFPGHECYVEPYGGAASVLLHKARSALEVYNDLDGAVVNFFRMLREHPDDLVRALTLTPYSRAELDISYLPTDDSLEAARRFYVRAFQTIGGATAQWRTGWRYQVKAKNIWRSAAASFCDVSHLLQITERLRGVQIEHDEALTVIQRFDRPNTLFYLDPPYVHSTRSKWAGVAYAHEMGNEDHAELAEAARAAQGYVVISGYPCELYDTLYGAEGWHKHETSSRTNGPAGRIRTEALWLSPRTADALALERGARLL